MSKSNKTLEGCRKMAKTLMTSDKSGERREGLGMMRVISMLESEERNAYHDRWLTSDNTTVVNGYLYAKVNDMPS
tara:strand:+ start:130 stop:354 length:225 start_codon:yes stop_codon:yes gene_type:complete